MSPVARRLALLFLLPLLLAAGAAEAHKPSDSYLALRLSDKAAPLAIDGRWDIALRDLDFALGLDTDGDGRLTWDEVRSRHADIAAYAMPRLGLAAGCQLRVTGNLIDHHTDGAYAVLLLRGACQPGAVFGIDYQLFSDLDAQHRGMASFTVDGKTQSAVLGGDRTRFTAGGGAGDNWRQAIDYLRHGVWHIWTGYDHILFLLSLLLPAVLAKGWRPASADVLRIVTAFTLAHSITLSLAALQVVTLPSRLVESAIAASVAVAALNNIWPLVQGKRWLAAFTFGLLHGFGFAGVLGDLGLPRGAAALALAAFNVGVELGQLAIVAAFVPLAYAMRSTWVYRQVLVKGGSGCIAVLAMVWLAERAAV
ncbi:HupE/UreJ family protein [Pseudoduganella violaceinigra]|uniref:HupE/UreJ family protein n=1 Tax=Pseudoduganella violaceinigra TaxID=246602 RepID=UPI00041B5253|nr:HupE/UreJ family protein [Pseudoduganella violaceinigra]